jgi:hypothetical protein
LQGVHVPRDVSLDKEEPILHLVYLISDFSAPSHPAAKPPGADRGIRGETLTHKVQKHFIFPSHLPEVFKGPAHIRRLYGLARVFRRTDVAGIEVRSCYA